jgi:PAS domain S-box-containing protein
LERVLLKNLSERIRLCHDRAAEAYEHAQELSDPEAKADFLAMERRWLLLAQSYEFGETLGDFLRAPRSPGGTFELASRNDAATVLANTPFLLTRCSSDLRFLFVSEAYAKMIGHRPEEVVGKKIEEVIGQKAFETIVPYIEKVLQGHRVEYEMDVDYKDVGERCLHVTYTPDRDRLNCVQGWVASVIEITEKRRAEQRIAAYLRAMTLLRQIGSECVRDGATEDECLHQILDAAIIISGAQKGDIQLADPSSDLLRITAQRGFKKPFLNFFENVGKDDASACAAALQSGTLVIIEDVLTNEVFVGQPSQKILLDEDVRAVISTPLTSSKGHTLGMLSMHFQQPLKPQQRELHLIDLLTRQAADYLERNQTARALRESEQELKWLASIVESSDDAIVSKNLDGVITSWNPGAECIFGYTAQEAIGRPFTIVVPEDRHDEERDILARIRRGEHIDHFETVRRRKDGRLIDISVMISPIKNAERRIVGASKIARDITEQKRIQRQIATLAREAEHRAKNMLATVQAAVNVSHSDSCEDLKQAIEGRIQALANVHSLFVESRWIGAELSRIATQELAPYSERDETRVRIDGPEVLLAPNTAQAIAIVLHELATNAAKYGALSVTNGQVDLKWSYEPMGPLQLRWMETGGPAVQEPMRKGSGWRLIDGLIAQLKGNLRFDWRAKGLVCQITLKAPVPDDRAL